jgi:hypothetical protein
VAIERQLGENSRVTEWVTSHQPGLGPDTNKATSSAEWHDPRHPLSRSNFGCFCFHFRFDIRHCMHAYGTHNAQRIMGNAPKSFAHGDLLAMIPAGVSYRRQRRLWRWRRHGQNATTSEGFGQDRDVSHSVAFREPFPLAQAPRVTKAKLSLIIHHTQTSSSSHLISHLI